MEPKTPFYVWGDSRSPGPLDRRLSGPVTSRRPMAPAKNRGAGPKLWKKLPSRAGAQRRGDWQPTTSYPRPRSPLFCSQPLRLCAAGRQAFTHLGVNSHLAHGQKSTFSDKKSIGAARLLAGIMRHLRALMGFPHRGPALIRGKSWISSFATNKSASPPVSRILSPDKSGWRSFL